MRTKSWVVANSRSKSVAVTDFLIFREAACRVLDDGKSVGKNFVERFFIAFQHLFLQFVDLIEDDNAVFDRAFLQSFP